MSVSITVTGDSDVQAHLEHIAAGMAGPALGTAVYAGGEVVRGAAQANVTHRSNNLSNSIHTSEPQVSATSARVTVGSNVIYARIQERGGTIYAKGGGWLVFQTNDGNWHKVKSVTLPAQAYLRRAVDEHRADVVAAIRAALAAQIGGGA